MSQLRMYRNFVLLSLSFLCLLELGFCLRDTTKKDIGVHASSAGFLISTFHYRYLVNITFGANNHSSFGHQGSATVSPLKRTAGEIEKSKCEPVAGQLVVYHVQLDEKATWSKEISKHPFLVTYQASPVSFNVRFHPDDIDIHARNFKLGFAKTLVPQYLQYSRSQLEAVEDRCGFRKDNFCEQRSNSSETELKCWHHVPIDGKSDDAERSPLAYATKKTSNLQRIRYTDNGIMDTSVQMELQGVFLGGSSGNDSAVDVITAQVLSLMKISVNNFTSLKPEEMEALIGKFVDASTFKTEPKKLTDVPKNKPSSSLTALLKKLRKHTSKGSSATVRSARAFLALVKAAKTADEKEIVDIIQTALATKKKQSTNIHFVLDIFAASGSAAAFQVFQKASENNDPESMEIFQRYIMALSFGLSPSKPVTEALLALINKKNLDAKLQETAALALGAIGKKLAAKADGEYKEVQEEIQKVVTSGLVKCIQSSAETKQQCQTMWLRALGNLGSFNTLPLVMEFIKSGGTPGAVALHSLSEYGRDLSSSEIWPQLVEAIWMVMESPHPRYNSNCKTAAVEWMTRYFSNANPSEAVKQLRTYLSAVDTLRSEEVRTFAVSRLLDYPPIQRQLRACSTKPPCATELAELLMRYGQKGQSISYKGSLATRRFLNATYDLAMEFAAGSMKTSAVKVALEVGSETLDVISFGLYSYGLASFMGGSEADGEDEDKSVTAGLVLGMMGVALPKIVFFNGLGELTSMAMSASGTDPVAEMQFNVLIQNETLVIPLISGHEVRLCIVNSVAAHLAGFIDISLWYRTSKSLVRNRAAFASQVDTVLYSEGKPVASAKSLQEAQGKMDFVTNVDFSNFPIKLCMQMSNGNIKFSTYHTTNHLTPTGTKWMKKSWKHSSPASSFAFGKANAKNCREMA